MKKIITLITFMALLTSCLSDKTSANLAEGHEQGNGYGEWSSTTDLSAWVTGADQGFKYCTTVDKRFGLAEETIQKNIEQAFNTWKQYIEAKKINAYLMRSFFEYSKASYWPQSEAKAQIMLLPTKYKRMTNCDGTENIRFFFGTKNAFIQQHLDKLQVPAFAVRINYDRRTGQGRGLIYVESNFSTPSLWESPNRLLGILIHEIGHAYGIGHVDGTIMGGDSAALNYSFKDSPELEHHLTSIDHEAELFFPDLNENSKIYEGEMAYQFRGSKEKSNTELQTEASLNFEYMTGLKPQGQVSSQFLYPQLTLSDEFNSYKFSLINVTASPSFSIKDGVFWSDRSWKNDPDFITAISEDGSTSGNASVALLSKASLITAEIVNSSGTKLSVIIEQNMGQQMQISYIYNGERKALMATFHNRSFYK